MSLDAAHREWGEAPLDPHDVDVAVDAPERLRAFNKAGFLLPADVYAAQRLCSLCREPRAEVMLALALTIRALRQGSVCLDLAELRTDQFAVEASLSAQLGLGDDSLLIDPEAMLSALADSALVSRPTDPEPGSRPLVLAGTSLYLTKYHQQEELVASALDIRARQGRARLGQAQQSPEGREAEAALVQSVNALMDKPNEARQRLAALLTRHWPLVVVAGGPGTGKTTTVARLLAVLTADARHSGRPRPRIALAAPTGKAAARLSEAVSLAVAQLPAEERSGLEELRATTLHRLLGGRPRGGFTRNASHPLAEDVVVVDETSMVSLSMMASLFDAVGPHTTVILVGDPDQLASVEAGAVLADIVARAGAQPLDADVAALVTELTRQAGVELPDTALRLIAGGVVELTHRFRFSGQIEELASAIVAGEPARAVQALRDERSGPSRVQLIALADDHDHAAALNSAVRTGALTEIRQRCVDGAAAMVTAATAGDGPAALEALRVHQLLTAHRTGPFGVKSWQRHVESWLIEDLPGYADAGQWFLGRPVMATVNDRDLGVFNGDTGVVIDHPHRGRVVVFGSPTHPLYVAPARLGPVETVNALTIHKSQGSQYGKVSLILPPPSSPLLTRELLYTAVTRAEREVLLVGSPAAIETAITRPVRRASGLRSRHALGRS